MAVVVVQCRRYTFASERKRLIIIIIPEGVGEVLNLRRTRGPDWVFVGENHHRDHHYPLRDW